MELDNKIEFIFRALSKGLSTKDIYIVVLREKYGTFLFPFPISKEHESVIECMLYPLQGKKPVLVPSLRQLYAASGVIISSICINNVAEGEFKADVYQIHDGEETSCVVSAGDALILALYFRVPIYVDQRLMKEAFSNGSEHTFSLSIKSLSKDMLKDALEEAIKKEQYEIASIIRDELKKRE